MAGDSWQNPCRSRKVKGVVLLAVLKKDALRVTFETARYLEDPNFTGNNILLYLYPKKKITATGYIGWAINKRDYIDGSHTRIKIFKDLDPFERRKILAAGLYIQNPPHYALLPVQFKFNYSHTHQGEEQFFDIVYVLFFCLSVSRNLFYWIEIKEMSFSYSQNTGFWNIFTENNFLK